MEGCLMEDKMAWKRVHAELVDNHRLAQDMSSVLAKARACCAELLSCLTTDGNSSSYIDMKDKTKPDTGVKGKLSWAELGNPFEFAILRQVI